MDAPVGECVADRLTKDAVGDFLMELLDDKPSSVPHKARQLTAFEM